MAHMPDKQRFLVTGSDGCIGSWVVRNLLVAGHEVVAVDLSAEPRRLRRILAEPQLAKASLVAADLTAEGVLEALVAEHAPTRVIHLAALQVPFVAADPVLGGNVNVVGTLRVLEAVRHSRQVRGLAYASSGAAIGPSHAPWNPDTLYGIFKRCNEECARIYTRDYATPSIGLRPCVVYGPGRDQGLTAALTHAIKAAVLGIPYEVPFGGVIDLQYAEDVANWFIGAALVDDNRGADVYDLHGTRIEVEDFIAVVEATVPAAKGLLSCATDPIPGQVDFDDTSLRERLGPIEKTDVATGVALSVRTFTAQRDSGVLTPDALRSATGVQA
jgi:UDP-glucuronate 4-epimerase